MYSLYYVQLHALRPLNYKLGVKHITNSINFCQNSQECVFDHAIVFILCQLKKEHKLFFKFYVINVNYTTIHLVFDLVSPASRFALSD